jgi:hypothetical protein
MGTDKCKVTSYQKLHTMKMNGAVEKWPQQKLGMSNHVQVRPLYPRYSARATHQVGGTVGTKAGPRAVKNIHLCPNRKSSSHYAVVQHVSWLRYPVPCSLHTVVKILTAHVNLNWRPQNSRWSASRNVVRNIWGYGMLTYLSAWAPYLSSFAWLENYCTVVLTVCLQLGLIFRSKFPVFMVTEDAWP